MRLLLLLSLALPASAARLKIDRYEAATLPDVRVWVTVLEGSRPLPPGAVRAFTVYRDGTPLPEPVEWQTVAQLGRPMAIALVIDARFPERWRQSREALVSALKKLPEASIALAVVTHDGNQRLPEKDWSERPDDLPVTMRQIEGGGREPRMYRGLRQALREFPLRAGLDKDPDEILPAPRPDKKTVPEDRALILVGDGSIEVEKGGKGSSDRLRELVWTARRRGVRIMSVGVTGEDAADLWTLEVLARKTRGTYRRAPSSGDLPLALGESVEELLGRFVIDAEAPGLRRGDSPSFQVRLQRSDGSAATSRDYTARAENVLGFWAGVADSISDAWEKWPWWVRALILGGVALIVGLILLIVLLKRAKKRRAARQAQSEAQAQAVAGRRPCAVCGQMMMADWTQCLFCLRAAASVRPMRFRLTGRSGDWAGQALRFDRELITLGSDGGCEVRVADRGVAPQHCGLRDRGGTDFVLTDFNTDGGTYVNGERISQVRISEGDIIRLGQTEFVFGVEA